MTSEVDDGITSPVFQFCKRTKNLVKGERYSADCTHYLLRVPNSVSDVSLSSNIESSSISRCIDPPKTLSLPNKAFRDQQAVKFYQKMASIESIGVCSLDFEMSATESILTKDLTPSDCTLQSINGTSSTNRFTRSKECLANNVALFSSEQRTCEEKPLTNGVRQRNECAVAEIKLPSYVGISCAISGYANFSRFCRSRDNSPARSSFRNSSIETGMLAQVRELSSLPFDNMCSNHRCARSQSDSNGTMKSMFMDSRQVDKELHIQKTFETKRDVISEINHSLAKEIGIEGTKSLVQQRIESLYGKSVCDEMTPSSFKISGKKNTTNESVKILLPRSPTSPGKARINGSSPPVFRHLTPDFRKQLQGDESHHPSIIRKKADNIQGLALCKTTLTSYADRTFDECDRIVFKVSSAKSAISNECNTSSDPLERAGHKLLTVVDLEENKIKLQIKYLEEDLKNAEVPEEASGKIRAACGKANLLLTQKFEQFRGLCRKNINESPDVPFYTTASDLAGFWDMVMLQVDDINLTFKEIQIMKENEWKEIEARKKIPDSKPRKPSPNAVSKSNPCTPKRSSAKSSELSRVREEARRQLLAAKKKGRQMNTNSDDDVAIFTPATTN